MWGIELRSIINIQTELNEDVLKFFLLYIRVGTSFSCITHSLTYIQTFFGFIGMTSWAVRVVMSNKSCRDSIRAPFPFGSFSHSFV